ncbi:hypothetical protein B0H13DRAFT_1883665 [Mycena leptocephala]|nr:hypothetical protein B0H13DRAFT_1883665 [Mycena leptocephala]
MEDSVDPLTALARAIDQAGRASTDARALADQRELQLSALRGEVASLELQRTELERDLALSRKSEELSRRLQKNAEETLTVERNVLTKRTKALEKAENELRRERQAMAADLNRTAAMMKTIADRQISRSAKGSTYSGIIRRRRARRIIESDESEDDVVFKKPKIEPQPLFEEHAQPSDPLGLLSNANPASNSQSAEKINAKLGVKGMNIGDVTFKISAHVCLNSNEINFQRIMGPRTKECKSTAERAIRCQKPQRLFDVVRFHRIDTGCGPCMLAVSTADNDPILLPPPPSLSFSNMASSGSDALILWDPVNLSGVQIEQYTRPNGRWAVVLSSLLNIPSGCTLDRVNTSLGRVMEGPANRAAYRFGLERVQPLLLLRNSVPKKLEKLCWEPYTAHAHRIRDTKFPGVDLLDSISALWDHPLGGPHDPEWEFWQAFNAISLYDADLELHQSTCSTRKPREHPGVQSQQTNPNVFALEKRVEELKVNLLEKQAELGADHPDTVDIMENLEETYSAWGSIDGEEQLAQARDFAESVMAQRARALGPEHPDTRRAIRSLESAYYWLDNRAKSSVILARSDLEAALRRQANIRLQPVQVSQSRTEAS